MRVHVWDKEREVDVYIEVLGLAALTSVVVAGSAFDYWPQRVRAFGPFRWLTFKRLTRFGESTMFVGLTKIQHQRERFVYRFTPSARKGWRVLAAAGCPTHLWREERPSLDICHAVTVTAREIDGRVTFIGDLHRNFSHVMLLSSEDGYYCLWMVQWDERNLQTVVWGNEWSEFWPAGKLLSLFVRPNDRLVIFDCDGDIGLNRRSGWGVWTIPRHSSSSRGGFTTGIGCGSRGHVDDSGRASASGTRVACSKRPTPSQPQIPLSRVFSKSSHASWLTSEPRCTPIPKFGRCVGRESDLVDKPKPRGIGSHRVHSAACLTLPSRLRG